MLGVDYQAIYCAVHNCKHNEKHIVRDGKTNKVIERYYTCEKSNINIDRKGRCKFAATKVLS
jgi:hypothetical protein